MSNAKEPVEPQHSVKQPAPTEHDEDAGDGEFKLTVRKLEMPVRPRGVLAE